MTPKISPQVRTQASLTETGTNPQREQPLNACRNLHRTICKTRGETRDPTGYVRRDIDGEIAALRIYEKIIHQHPDWSVDQVDELLVQEIYTEKRRKKLRYAYAWALRGIERFIEEQPKKVFTPAERKQLKTILRSTKLELPPPASTYEDEPDLFTKNDVFFEQASDGTRRLRVGGAFLLSVKSLFNMVFTFSHELAHSIDPCELRSKNLKLPAYERLSACFIKNRLITLHPDRNECENNDQLSETFADWIAVQVTSELLKKYATEFDTNQLFHAAVNTVKDLCDEEDGLFESETTEHPSPEVRIQGIFGAHPTIRSILKCEASRTPSCEFH